MAEFSMDELFRSANPQRDKLLSRVFGIFNEGVVRQWASDDRSRFVDLGRPTLRHVGETRWHTLDFTLQDQTTGNTFVTEMKCELEFEGYRYLVLTDARQVEHHTSGAAFTKLLALARDARAIPVSIAGRPVEVDGTALVWGATTPEGVESTKATFGFAEVLSVESMIRDLHKWNPAGWLQFLDERRTWLLELFDGLLGPSQRHTKAS